MIEAKSGLRANGSFIIILLLSILPQAATDLYLPSVAAMAQSFKVTLDLAQWTIAIFMVGMAISQLIYGPLSEGLGRKKPLLAGLILSFIGCAICLFAHSIEMLLMGRLLQGFGAGACSCLFRAILRDLFKGDTLVKYVSYLIMVYSAVAPAVPVLGGYLEYFFTWRASFMFLLGYTGLMVFLILAVLPESHRDAHHSKLKPTYLLGCFIQLLRSPLFMCYALFASIAAGSTFAWITSAPMLLIKGAGLTSIDFGWAMLVTSIIPTVCAGWMNPRLVKRFGVQWVLYFAWSLLFVSGGMFLLFYYFWHFLPAAIILPAAVFFFGSMFVYPNTYTMAFTPFGHIAGIAATLYAAIQMSGAALFSAIFSHFPWRTPIPLGFVLMGVALLSLMIYKLGLKRNLSID